MATYYCPQCGEEMEQEENGSDYYCDNCMCYFGIPQKHAKFYMNPLSYLLNEVFSNIDDEDKPGPGCRACGNPAYPECKDSCPLFDD